MKMLRFQAKQDADKQKAIILEKFEALKKKGRFGPEDLNSLDLGTASPKSGDNHTSALTKTTLSPV
jgi:hypothetical protein